MLRYFGNTLRRKISSRPRDFSSLSNPVIATHKAVEEETLQFYGHEQYYPVNIGDVFNSRYQVIGKLGYGAYSTVWLCRDLIEHDYASLKISTQLQNFPQKRFKELNIYKHLGRVESTHPGQRYIRDLYDAFDITGPHGCHQCLVQPAMHLSMLDMLKLNPEPLGAPLLKEILKRLLSALDFLHTEADVVHTDLKTDNIMFTVADPCLLEDFEKAEQENPSARKVIDSTRSIYTSRNLNIPRNGMWGHPVLCDLGEAMIGRLQHTGPFVQPHIYRAPEVVFEMPWGPPIDIWNVAALIWDLLEKRHLFQHIMDGRGNYDPFKHMAQIFALLGPPPREFVVRSETTLQCFDMNGHWIANEHEKPPSVSLEDLVTRLEGQEKKSFLRLIRSMLRWLPEERKTAKELLDDPWLNE